MPDFRFLLSANGVLGNMHERVSASFPGSAGDDQQTSAMALQEVSSFGSNPGNLRMLAHVPIGAEGLRPLVVALHGCGQTAADYARGTGWGELAESQGIVVIYPEQRSDNNPKSCFTWFLPGDIAREQGEAHSIQQMVGHAIEHLGVDPARVFVTGLSAGGAMTSVMLATYPEAYAGGAIVAGLPYGCAGSMQEAFEAMFKDQSRSTRDLGNSVRAASTHRGPWPRISVWHGSADTIVKPSNAEHIVRQWADVHGLDQTPSRTEAIGRHTRREWNDAEGRTQIEAYSIAGMAHGVPIDCSGKGRGPGLPGPCFLDVGVSSTLLIARSWGLVDGAWKTGAEPVKPHNIAQRGVGWHSLDERRQAIAAQDPARVIADALAAARPSVIAAGKTAPGTAAPKLDPDAIIAAALKAAGLK